MSPSQRPLLRLRVAAAAYRFRESLFALPASIVAVGVILAEATAALDRHLAAGGGAGMGVQMNSNGATWLLSTVAGATITTAGVVFSLTVVSLQLASSQFSPRVMRSFIRDRFSQTVIGMLVATFVYCVLTLRHVSGVATNPAPNVSMTAALVLTVATVVLIVAYLDRLAHGLQVGHVVAFDRRRGAHGDRCRHGDDPTRTAGPAPPRPADRRGGRRRPGGPRRVGHPVPGRTHPRRASPGDGGASGNPSRCLYPSGRGAHASVAGPRRPAEGAASSPGDRGDLRHPHHAAGHRLRGAATGRYRPARAQRGHQRPHHRHRSGAPAGQPAAGAADHCHPSLSVRGTGGRVLLRPWALSPEEYIEHAFEPIRQTSAPQLHVATALARVLRMLIEHVRLADRREHLPALERQLRMLVDAVDTEPGLHPEDVRRFRAIAESPVDPAEHPIR